MADKASEEIFREEGENFRSVRVTLGDDGGLTIDTQDMGPLVEKVWGDSDYEFWVNIPPEATARLAYALLRRHYRGRADAVDDLRKLCEAEGIPHTGGSWA